MSISPENYTPFDDHSEWVFDSHEEDEAAPLVSMTLNELIAILLYAAKDKMDFEKRLSTIHPAMLRGEIAGAGARLNSFKTSMNRARGFSELTLYCYEKHGSPLTVKIIRGFIAALCRQHGYGLEMAQAMPLDEAAKLLSHGIQSNQQALPAGAVDGRANEEPKPARRSSGVPRDEAEILVRDWLAENAKENPNAITRDAVVAGGSEGEKPPAVPCATTDDGPYGVTGFRFKGKLVDFGRANLRLRLMKSLWDEKCKQPSVARPVQAVISEVYGDDEGPEDSAFRQLCSDTRTHLLKQNCPLNVQYVQGFVQLVAL